MGAESTQPVKSEPTKDRAGNLMSDLFQANAARYNSGEFLHELNLYYAEVVSDLPFKATVFIREPSYNKEPIVELTDGQVLKFGALTEGWGQRPFDCPVITQGKLKQTDLSFSSLSEVVLPTDYYVQPEVDIADEFELVKKFIDQIKLAGWADSDIGYAGQGQVGWLDLSNLGTQWTERAQQANVLVTDDQNRALVLIDYESVVATSS